MRVRCDYTHMGHMSDCVLSTEPPSLEIELPNDTTVRVTGRGCKAVSLRSHRSIHRSDQRDVAIENPN